jgi:hypothetical protein
MGVRAPLALAAIANFSRLPSNRSSTPLPTPCCDRAWKLASIKQNATHFSFFVQAEPPFSTSSHQLCIHACSSKMTIELKRVMRYPISGTEVVKTAAHCTNLTCGIYVQPRAGQHGTIVCGANTGSLFLWKINFRQGIDSCVLPHTELQRHSGPVRSLAYEPEHNLLFR